MGASSGRDLQSACHCCSTRAREFDQLTFDTDEEDLFGSKELGTRERFLSVALEDDEDGLQNSGCSTDELKYIIEFRERYTPTNSALKERQLSKESVHSAGGGDGEVSGPESLKAFVARAPQSIARGFGSPARSPELRPALCMRYFTLEEEAVMGIIDEIEAEQLQERAREAVSQSPKTKSTLELSPRPSRRLKSQAQAKVQESRHAVGDLVRIENTERMQQSFADGIGNTLPITDVDPSTSTVLYKVHGCERWLLAKDVELVEACNAQQPSQLSLFYRELFTSVHAETENLEEIAGPWGVSTTRGGELNAWSDIDPSSFNVRGPDYFTSRKKVSCSGAVCELLVVDLFMCKDDISCVSRCSAAGTVQRLRLAGEKRRLILLNFRIVPLHFVIVWALPQPARNQENLVNPADPAEALIAAFMGMTNQERSQRLKVIPRVRQGPWLARKAVGETPALLGKNVPCEYYESADDFEISVGVASSGAAQKICRVLVYAAKAVDIELAVLIESKTDEELPEKLIGGFRVRHPDISTLRTVTLPE